MFFKKVFLLFVILFPFVHSNYVFNRESSIKLLNGNHVSIVGPINEVNINNQIKKLEQISENDDIYIYIKSPGGEVMAGERFIQYMEYVKNRNKKLHCIADTALSMAFHIFQFCDTRLVLPSSKLMQHQISMSISGNIENINNYVNHIQKINKYFANIESQKFGITEYDYFNKISTDWWLYGQEIIDNRVADIMIKSVGCSSKLMDINEYIETETMYGKIKEKQPACPIIKSMY